MTPAEVDDVGNVEGLYQTFKGYVDTRLDLVKLSLVRKVADGATSALSRVITLLLILVAVMMLNIGLSLWLGEYLGAMHWGFLVVAGFYFVIGVLFYLMRNIILKNPISSALIKKALK